MFSDSTSRVPRSLPPHKSGKKELDDELRFHFDQHVEKLVAAGVPRDGEVRQARLTFGGVDSIKEECRDARGVRLLDVFLARFPLFVRILAKNWKLAGIAIVYFSLSQ